MEFFSEFILIRNTPLGDLQIRYYGIIIVTAMMIAAYVASNLASRVGKDSDHIWGGLTWGIFPGIIGARLWFVVFPPASLTIGCETGTGVCMDTAWFLANFFNMENGAIAVWSGGLSIFGAVLGGLLGVWLYLSPWHNRISRIFHYIFLPIGIVFSAIEWGIMTVIQRIRGKETKAYAIPKFEPEFPDEGFPVMPWLDIAAISLPLAQGIGRLANYVNQELYGLPTGASWWGIPIDAENRIGIYADKITYPLENPTTLFHPLFLYEMVWNIAAFFILRHLYLNNRQKFQTGDFFLLYIIQYSVVRFFLEFLRVEPAYVPGTQINSSQTFTAIIFVFALVFFLFRRRQAQNSETVAQS